MEHPTCDICKAEFPSSKPNLAVLDAPLRGNGAWAYFCSAHKGNAVPNVGTTINPEDYV